MINFENISLWQECRELAQKEDYKPLPKGYLAEQMLIMEENIYCHSSRPVSLLPQGWQVDR